jgi:hypothetical protein
VRPWPASLCALGLALAPCAAAWAQASAAQMGAQAALEALVGGDFRDPFGPGRRPAGRLPWWRVQAGAPELDSAAGELRLPAGSAVEQPLAALPGALLGLTISGELGGGARLLLRDGRGGERLVAQGSGAGFQAFEWRLTEVEPALLPRLRLCIEAPAADGAARRLSAGVPLPRLEEPELRAAVVVRLVELFEPWLAGALDRSGPRATAFVVGAPAADTGRLAGNPGRRVSLHPLYSQLLRAFSLEPRADWEAALLNYLADYLELAVHPGTGLPRLYDPVEDAALDEQPVEIAAHLEFLLDWSEFGPEAGRERARAAARRMALAALEHGRLPDGSVAAKFVPKSGATDTSTVELRRLDVPARWVRAFGSRGVLRAGAPSEAEAAALEAAVEAVHRLELYHHWAGTWDRIDPGFDDEYGHYGARAVEMWAAEPEQPVFRELALSGLERFGPLWDEALAFGGNIAADQVRCWQIAAKIALLDPALSGQIEARLEAAAHVHFTGQQNAAGDWIDTTVVGFDPQNLPVGDTLGVPQNLLSGLALVAENLRGPARARALARFQAVLLQSEASFRRPFGFVDGKAAAAGAPATGTLRVAPGLIGILRAIPAED